MASLDSLPGYQRAVLQLVLSRGRSYEKIGVLLSINPSAVRERAQLALDALGPDTHITPEAQARVADYLLGQLPDSETRRCATAGRLPTRAPGPTVSSGWLPWRASARCPRSQPTRRRRATAEPIAGLGPAQPESNKSQSRPGRGAGAGSAQAEQRRRPRRGLPVTWRFLETSRVVAGAVLFFVLRGGDSNNHAAASTSTVSSSAARPTPPHHHVVIDQRQGRVADQSPRRPAQSEAAAGIAEVLNEGSTDGVAIVAQNVPPNSTKPPDAYAVWLYNSPKDAKILGFVNPGVGKTGRLSTAGALPTNASRYKQLIVTVETTASPKAPGNLILQCAATHLPSRSVFSWSAPAVQASSSLSGGPGAVGHCANRELLLLGDDHVGAPRSRL
jgi:hypothetical protein